MEETFISVRELLKPFLENSKNAPLVRKFFTKYPVMSLTDFSTEVRTNPDFKNILQDKASYDWMEKALSNYDESNFPILSSIVGNTYKLNTFRPGHYAFLNDSRFQHDMEQEGIPEMISEIRQTFPDYYPLTQEERRRFVTRADKHVADAINWTLQDGQELPQVRHFGFDSKKATNLETPTIKHGAYLRNYLTSPHRRSNMVALDRGLYDDNTNIMYLPYRNSVNTLIPNSSILVETPAHETRHYIQHHFIIPIAKYDENVQYYVPNDGTTGNLLDYAQQILDHQLPEVSSWEQSPGEWDAEAAGQRQLKNWPQFSKMTKEQQQKLIDYLNSTFQMEDLKVPLEEQPFYKYLMELNKHGYKQGGKLIKK